MRKTHTAAAKTPPPRACLLITMETPIKPKGRCWGQGEEGEPIEEGSPTGRVFPSPPSCDLKATCARTSRPSWVMAWHVNDDDKM